MQYGDLYKPGIIPSSGNLTFFFHLNISVPHMRLECLISKPRKMKCKFRLYEFKYVISQKKKENNGLK